MPLNDPSDDGWVGRVYFVVAGPFLKVGFTTKPASKRAMAMQNVSPFDAELVAVLYDATTFDERKIHQHLRHAQLKGEWFASADDESQRLIEVASRCSTMAEFQSRIRDAVPGAEKSVLSCCAPEKWPIAFAERVKALRLSRGWTLKAAARALGVNPTTLCAIEHRPYHVSAMTVRKLAEGYGVRPIDIVHPDQGASP